MASKVYHHPKGREFTISRMVALGDFRGFLEKQ